MGDRAAIRARYWFPAAVLLAIILRLSLLPMWTVDQRDFLMPWLSYAETHGAGYLKQSFTNYAPFYEHVLAFLAQLPGPGMLRIKLFSILFDLVMAGLIAAMVPPAQRRLGIALFLLTPTVLLNASAWGQCDVIYASMVMLAFLLITRDRPALAMLTFGFAVAIKLQAAIFAPMFLLMTLERRQPIWTYLLAPLPYLILALPMLAAGRGAMETFLVYAGQFNQNDKLAAVAPNPWIVLNKLMDYRLGVMIGFPLAAAIVGATVLWFHRQRIARSTDGLYLAAALIVLLVPFVTPKMHDRFFYLVDPMVILLVCRDRRYWKVLALTEGASLLSYIPFTFISTDQNGAIFRSYIWMQEHYGSGYGILAAPAAVLMGIALWMLAKRAWAMRDDAGPGLGVTPLAAAR